MKVTVLSALVALQCVLLMPAIAGPMSGLAPELRRFTVEMRAGADTVYAVNLLRASGVVVNNVIKDVEGDVVVVTYDPDRPPNMSKLQPLAALVQSYAPDVRRRVFATEVLADDNVIQGQDVVPWGIAAVGSQGITYGGGIKICIIDTGYALGHPDLPARTVSGDIRDLSIPWNEDTHGHGTHVAGTIAALGGNQTGVVGVIDNGNPDIFVVRALADGGWTYASDQTAAFLSCANNGAKVVNMSYGGFLPSPLEERVLARLQRRGVLFVAAAGNGMGYGSSVPISHTQPLAYPGSYPSVLTVAAIDSELQRAGFSQMNSSVDLAAPGVTVLSTAPKGSYASMDGTSMASPHVAGVAALVWSRNKSCSVTEITNALKKSAADIGDPGYDYGTGWGLVQAPGALDYLKRHPCTGAM